jgi:hypothetical protein
VLSRTTTHRLRRNLLIASEAEKEAHNKLITWKEVLKELRRCDGQITDYGRPVGQILFDPAVGVARSSERIEPETFALLCEEGWIATQDQGRIRRYTISEMGIARLDEVEPEPKVLARGAGSS